MAAKQVRVLAGQGVCTVRGNCLHCRRKESVQAARKYCAHGEMRLGCIGLRLNQPVGTLLAEVVEECAKMSAITVE